MTSSTDIRNNKHSATAKIRQIVHGQANAKHTQSLKHVERIPSKCHNQISINILEKV